jgi:hypothetical protein
MVAFAVYTLAQRNCRELFVRRLLFIEIGVEQTDDVVMAEAIGPGDQGPVPRNLVVFDRLRCSKLGATNSGRWPLGTPPASGGMGDIRASSDISNSVFKDWLRTGSPF